MAANTGFAGFSGHRQGNGDIAATEGLTSFSITTNNRGFIGNYNLEIGKKYYWEVRAKSFGGSQDQLYIGVCKDDIDLTANRGGGGVSGGGYGFENYNNNVYLSSSSSAGSGPGQFRSPPNNVRVKVDRVNHTISWALDDGSFSSTYSIPSTGRLYPWLGSGGGSNTAEARANFGQDSTFSGDLTAQTNTDQNGFSEFYYSVPSGFLACCNGNRGVDSNIDPNLTDDDHPQKQFTVEQYTGNNSSRTVNIGFQPDLILFKIPATGNSWSITDTVRGGTASSTKTLKTDDESAESTGAFVALTGYVSNGFTLTSSSGSDFNTNSTVYNAHCWRAGGAPSADNSAGAGNTPTANSVKIDGSNLGSALAGSIPATRLSANTKAGCSIITYAGTGSNGTIAHGLSQKPEFFWVKDRDRAESWNVYHVDIGATKYLVLNDVSTAETNSNRWNDTEPTSTTISLGTNDNTNGSSNYVCYAWHSVPGYSSFGSYSGSGQTDGRYIDLGFRPKFLIIKKFSEASTTYGWANFNTSHQTSNKATFSGGWLDTGASWSGNYDVQILGSGFKMRNNNTNLDASGKTYIYAAWGDCPAKYNNGF